LACRYRCSTTEALLTAGPLSFRRLYLHSEGDASQKCPDAASDRRHDRSTRAWAGQQRRLERVLQTELQLAHGNCRRVDDPKGRRRPVPVGRTPYGMVEHIECFQAELEYMPFLVAQREVLMDRQIERLK